MVEPRRRTLPASVAGTSRLADGVQAADAGAEHGARFPVHVVVRRIGAREAGVQPGVDRGDRAVAMVAVHRQQHVVVEVGLRDRVGALRHAGRPCSRSPAPRASARAAGRTVPARSAASKAARPTPFGATTPIPVTTTRRPVTLFLPVPCAAGSGLDSHAGDGRRGDQRAVALAHLDLGAQLHASEEDLPGADRHAVAGPHDAAELRRHVREDRQHAFTSATPRCRATR